MMDHTLGNLLKPRVEYSELSYIRSAYHLDLLPR
jgi:hypothetical protein